MKKCEDRGKIAPEKCKVEVNINGKRTGRWIEIYDDRRMINGQLDSARPPGGERVR